MSDAVVLARVALVRLGWLAGRLLPIRRRVVLATASAERIGGNLSAIRAALERAMPDVPVIVAAHRPAGGLRGRVAAGLRTVVAGFRLATSALFVLDDYYFPAYAVRPRSGTSVVQVWHASGAFKKMGYSLRGKSFGASAAVLRHVRIHSTYALCLVSAERFIPHYVEAFRLPADRFTSRIGIPRTDPLVDETWQVAARNVVRRRYAIPDDRRVVLYAPTFRGERTADARAEGLLDFELLHRRLGADHVLLLRLHPFIRSRAAVDPALAGFVVDASTHPDIHELMAASDVLVTDYSSAIYEYALFGRPMAFFAPDHAAYERERGFYFDYETGVPGPVFGRTEDLAEHLRSAEFDLDRVHRFAAQSFDVADGRASERFVQAVVRPALGRT